MTALADTIVPKSDSVGALDAEVPAKLDALVGIWATPEHKAEIIAAIDRVDVEARAKHGKGFAALSPAERTAFLTPYDAAALKVPPAAPAPAVSSSQSTVAVGGVATKVDPNSDAAEKGLQPGDVVQRVGGRAVHTPADVQSGVAEAQKGGRKSVLLLVASSQGGSRFVAVDVGT